MPTVISKNIENALVNAFAPVDIDDWNFIFWVVHPEVPVILDMVEAKVCLNIESPGLWGVPPRRWSSSCQFQPE
jgi:chalcone synthase